MFFSVTKPPEIPPKMFLTGTLPGITQKNTSKILHQEFPLEFVQRHPELHQGFFFEFFQGFPVELLHGSPPGISPRIPPKILPGIPRGIPPRIPSGIPPGIPPGISTRIPLEIPPGVPLRIL